MVLPDLRSITIRDVEKRNVEIDECDEREIRESFSLRVSPFDRLATPSELREISGKLMSGSNFSSTQQFSDFMRAAKRHFFRFQYGDNKERCFSQYLKYTSNSSKYKLVF